MTKDKSTSVYFDRDKLQFVGIEDIHMKQLKEVYKGIDIDRELKKMGLWLVSSNGKKRTGNLGFILNWLNHASPPYAVPTKTEQLNMMDYDSPLRPLIIEYLKDLWKGKQNILELNKIKKIS